MRDIFNMIDILPRSITYTAIEQNWVDTLINSNLTHQEIWSGSVNSTGVRRKDRDALITKIKIELEQIQNGYCYYCGFKFTYRLGEKASRKIQREHIAPKSRYKEFTFEAENLVLACDLCNSTDYKGDINTILAYSNNYNACTFNIIHPYLDHRQRYLSLDESGLLCVLRSSNKGKNTVELFGLNEKFHVENRAMHTICSKYNVDSVTELLLQAQLAKNTSISQI
ncbi:HNH endonuclease [Pseudoalteromonas apostichopi]|uniref:HNH endonuclease n=1 Tax=Pseudoalteromonas apostichopi TaxID=3035452 RepID=UPI0025741966|nr:HNH endonuclease [Pseudoalteromonas sp. FE4]